MATPAEELSDSFLEKISGGGDDLTTGQKVGLGVAAGLAGAYVTAGLGTMIAMDIYRAKAKRAYKRGNYTDRNKYLKKADRCEKIALGITTFGIGTAIDHYANS